MTISFPLFICRIKYKNVDVNYSVVQNYFQSQIDKNQENCTRHVYSSLSPSLSFPLALFFSAVPSYFSLPFRFCCTVPSSFSFSFPFCLTGYLMLFFSGVCPPSPLLFSISFSFPSSQLFRHIFLSIQEAGRKLPHVRIS